MPCARRIVGWVVIAVWAFAGRAFAQQYDPSLVFETIETPHFLIHYHQGEQALAARLAPLAEEIYSRARTVFSSVPSGRTHVIISGQDDVPNGWATPFPYNVIEVRTTWPRPSALIGYADDWLRLVFAHEFTHIVHLDRSRGIMAAARTVFGRAPFVMPNLFLPTWQVEGIATWQESATTGLGRVRDGMSRRLLRSAAAVGQFPGLDRVSGGVVSWPAGDGPYVYGGIFHEYLAERFGADAIDRWANATAAWPPFLGFLAFGRTFDISSGAAWQAFEADAARSAAPPANVAGRVTTDGFFPGAPRWDRSRPGAVLYSRQTPDGFPALMRVDVASREATRVAWRFMGSGLGTSATRAVFDQLEVRTSVALQGDLYALDLATGATSRLTSGERAMDPDLTIDGGRLVYVAGQADRRGVVVREWSGAWSSPRVVVSEPGVFYSAPRWAPNGREVVAERARPGTLPDVVVIDTTTGVVEPVAPGVGDRQATPTWTPDGQWVVMAVAEGSVPFALVAVSRADRHAWTVLATSGGARAPDISPDGSRLAYLGFTAAGEDVVVVPFDRATWVEGPRATVRPAGTAEVVQHVGGANEPRAYAPLASLLPRYWSPVLQLEDEVIEIGGETSGRDPLGRHTWSAAGWRRSDSGRVDWDASYVYARWRPTVFVSASGEARVFGDVRQSTRSAAFGVSLPFSRVRRAQQVFASIQIEKLSAVAASGQSASVDRHAVRAGWAWSSARAFGYSVSPEEGGRFGVTTEHVLPALGASARADAAAADGRWFWRLGAEHAVLAVRAAGAAARGDRFVRRRFGAGCRNGATGLTDLGSDAVALLRGVNASCSLATRASVANVDYRFPLWRVERGVGVYPAFLRWVHAGVFTDVGDQWDAGDRPRWKLSTGVELSADVVVGHALPLTLVTGVAWVHDAANDLSRGPRAYVRIGRAF